MSETSRQRERWDRRHRERRDDEGASAPLRFLVDQVEPGTTGRALVLAMGRGRNALFLAERGLAVTGVDVSPVAVAMSCERARRRSLPLQGLVADVGELELGHAAWDLVTLFYYLDRRLFPRIVAALAPGGRFLLETFGLDHPGIASFGPRNADFLVAPNELFGLVAPLRVRLYEDRVETVCRDGRRDRAAIVRLLAEKPAADEPGAEPD